MVSLGSDPDDPLIGRTLGEFVVREKLGAGGFGAVYRAEQPLLEREAVIKVLHARHRTDEGILGRFMREARLASRLEHPYAAHIYAFGAESDGLMWLAMEYVRGTPLDKLLASRGPLPLDRMVPLLDQIAEVVHAAHDHGVVHRDLKPANVMVLARGGRMMPKLLDFGIAKGVDGRRPSAIALEPPRRPSELEIGQTMAPATAAAGPADRPSHEAIAFDGTMATRPGRPSNQPITNPAPADPAALAAAVGAIAPPDLHSHAELAFEGTMATRPARPSNQPPIANPAPADPAALAQVAAGSGIQPADRPTIRPSEPAIRPSQQIVTITSARRDDASVTMHGVAIGSPSYMAPEQWRDAAAVDARADVYALGAMVFECITGRKPFDGSTIAEIERAHLTKPVPPVGDTLPAALDGVLARALAKHPEDRFASPIDFATAFRAAAGLGEQAAPLPALDENLRDRVLADAPQPIAEAVAALGAARNVHQVRDGLADLTRVIVRYLGVLAIACRTRIGPGSGDSPRATELMQTLRRRGLSDDEWVELVRELTAPYATQPDVYPLPELVALFSEPVGSAPTAPGQHQDGVMRVLEELLGVSGSERHGGAEEDVRDQLARALPCAAQLLTELAFLAAYPLVLPRGGTADRWMGIARTRRTVVPIASAIPDDRPLLVDRNGVPVLALWPLVQIAAPTPGAPEDVFLLAGKGRHGARLVALPAGFERQDEALWAWFRDQLGIDEGVDAAAAKEQAPYRGLAAFTPEDAGMFFGREREAEAFLNRLRVSPLLAVVGASGAGKSSFVQAGVVPDLPAGWKTLTVRPGPTPLATLFAQLASWGVETVGLRDAIAFDPRALGERVRAAAKTTLVLIVDQFEEIFTLCHDREERRLYGAAIAQLARGPDDPVRAVLTMRDDFLLRAEQLPALRDRLGQGLELLAMPAPEDLRRILVEPARRHGYELEDAEMADEMIAQIADQPGALPLLAFAAAKLWEVRDRHFKTLPRKAYEAMGGVAGALAQHAETTLASLPPEDLLLVREAFRHLVTSEGTRAVLSRDELLQLLGSGPRAEAVVEKMVGARLLVAQEGEGEEEGMKHDAHIEVVHEALIRAWPRLVTWRHEDAEGARLRDQLRAAARQWDAKGRTRGHLWRAEQLTEYQLWRSRYRGRLTDLEEEFAGAALEDAARGRRIRRRILVVTAIVAVCVIVALLWLTDRARKQRALAEEANQRAEEALADAQARMIGLYEELGRQELAAGRQLRALVYLAAAYGRGGDGPALRSMLAQAARPVDAERERITTHTDWAVAQVWDRERLITAGKDGAITWWRARGDVTRRPAHPGGVTALAFGRRLASGGADGVTIWDSTQPMAKLPHGDVRALAWAIDGHRLAIGNKDGVLTVADERRSSTTLTLAGSLDAIEWSPDGTRIAVAGKAGTLWIATAGPINYGGVDPLPKPVALVHGAPILAIAWSPDGKRIATAGTDGIALVWDVATGKRLALTGHTLRVNAVAWSADGGRVVSSSKDATSRVWDATTGKQLLVLAGHLEEVNMTAFSPDGTVLATASDDRTARTWDARTGAHLMTFEGHTGGVISVAFSPRGGRISTVSYDKTARIWDAHAAARRAIFVATKGEVFDAAFVRRADGSDDEDTSGEIATSHVAIPPPKRVVAVGGTAGEAMLWQSLGREATPLAATGDTTVVRGSSTGRFVIASTDGTARVFERTGMLAFMASEGGSPLRAATFSPDGSRIAIGADNGGVRIVAGSGTFFLPKQGAVTSLAFAPNGTSIAVASSEGAGIHELTSANVARSIPLRGHTGAVTSVAWSPDGTKLLTTGADKTARIWSVDGRELAVLRGHTNSVLYGAWSPDGQRIATASWDRTAKLWRATGELAASLDRHTDWVMQVAFTADSGRLITASHDGTAMLWDVAGGKLLATFTHRDEVNTLEIVGERALTTSQDGTAVIWDLTSDRRTRAEIEELVRCRVPFQLDGDKLIPIENRCP